MSFPQTPTLKPSRRTAEWLWFAAGSLLGAMPVAMTIGHRSSPLFISLAAAVALAATAVEGGARAFVAALLSRLKTPLGFASLVFLAYAALSIAWSIAPGVSLHAFAEFVLPIAAVFALAVALPGRVPHDKASLLAIGVALACALIVFNLWTDVAVRRAFGLSAQTFIFNRPVLVVLVAAIPLLFLLHRSGNWWMAGALTLVVVATILMADSGAAALGLVVAVVVYGIARLSGRFAARLVGAGLIVAIAIAPVSGAILDSILPRAFHERLADAHPEARIEIWKAFGQTVREEPLTGSGYGVSPRFSETPVARRIAAENPHAFDFWHPHNAALQIWVELGAVGALLAGLVVVLIVRELERLRPDLLPARLALFAAVAAVSLVGHGAWQGWWPAAIGTAIIWFRCGEREFKGWRA